MRSFLQYLAMYKAKSFDDAIAKAEQLVADGGYGFYRFLICKYK